MTFNHEALLLLLTVNKWTFYCFWYDDVLIPVWIIQPLMLTWCLCVDVFVPPSCRRAAAWRHRSVGGSPGTDPIYWRSPKSTNAEFTANSRGTVRTFSLITLILALYAAPPGVRTESVSKPAQTGYKRWTQAPEGLWTFWILEFRVVAVTCWFIGAKTSTRLTTSANHS